MRNEKLPHYSGAAFDNSIVNYNLSSSDGFGYILDAQELCLSEDFPEMGDISRANSYKMRRYSFVICQCTAKQMQLLFHLFPKSP